MLAGTAVIGVIRLALEKLVFRGSSRRPSSAGAMTSARRNDIRPCRAQFLYCAPCGINPIATSSERQKGAIEELRPTCCLHTEAQNRTTRVLPNPDNSCGTDPRPSLP